MMIGERILHIDGWGKDPVWIDEDRVFIGTKTNVFVIDEIEWFISADEAAVIASAVKGSWQRDDITDAQIDAWVAKNNKLAAAGVYDRVYHA